MFSTVKIEDFDKVGLEEAGFASLKKLSADESQYIQKFLGVSAEISDGKMEQAFYCLGCFPEFAEFEDAGAYVFYDSPKKEKALVIVTDGEDSVLRMFTVTRNGDRHKLIGFRERVQPHNEAQSVN